jgi:peptide deformylase
MTILPLLHYPDPRLRTIAQPVVHFDSALDDLAQQMFLTMRHHNGIGLAATQVNQHLQLIVLDVLEPLVLVNARIVDQRDQQTLEEGCLSVPNVFTPIARSLAITVDYQDLKGLAHSLTATGLLAQCIQHELDHLAGRVFIDGLSQLKRDRLIAQAKKKH